VCNSKVQCVQKLTNGADAQDKDRQTRRPVKVFQSRLSREADLR
jgi:hypothetical protein